MNKEAPSFARVFVMAGFALSCFGILLYLWLTFGGSIPLQPKSYRVNINFNDAANLAQEADVRISGVPVGKVVKKELNRKESKTHAVLEIDSKYAPIPKDTRAILRQKTLLGETYVELTPGTRGGEAAKLPDNGTLTGGQVADTVQLDEIFRAFDPKTRADFRTWLEEQGRAVGARGRDLNNALGNLDPFAQNATTVLRILNEQKTDVRSLVRNTGVVFDALTERQGQLRGLITNSNRVFETTAARNTELADTFRAFPTFLVESRTTLKRLTRFANDTNPLINQLRPAAHELSPTLIDLKGLAPNLKALFRDIDPLVKASKSGLPAVERVLDNTRPVLAQLDPTLRQVNPILSWLSIYRREIAAFFPLDATATQATSTPPNARTPIHYLRTTNPVNPENLALYKNRLATNRSNPYTAPGGYDKLGKGGLEVFGRYLCTSNALVPLNPSNPLLGLLPAGTQQLVEQAVFGIADGNVAVPCRAQAPNGGLIGQSGSYAHVTAEP